jgi:hypothetical protein
MGARRGKRAELSVPSLAEIARRQQAGGDGMYANWPALQLAAWRGKAKLAASLLAGADAARRDRERRTAADFARVAGATQLADELAQAAAKGNRFRLFRP